MASDPTVLKLSSRAFALHGGIRLVNKAQAQFHAEFTLVSKQSVRVSLLDSQKDLQQAPRIIQGLSLQDAIMKGCDFVVEGLFTRPGFFAGKLAFVVKKATISEVFTSDIMFSQVRPITADQSLVTGPSWQPDGRGLLYTTYF